jgi:hypothetical protein
VTYKNFTAINNNIGMYWKGSRNMRTLGAPHIKVGNHITVYKTQYAQICSWHLRIVRLLWWLWH